jgi:hypothetical protein
MNLKNIFRIVPLVAMFVVTSCNWDELPEINQNPNQATTPRTSSLLTNAIISLGGPNTATQAALYAQYLSNKQYTSADNYQTINFSTDAFYSGPLMDLQKIIDMNTDEATAVTVSIDGANANQIAVAKILMSYFYLHMTDRWGDIPYSEALKGAEGLLRPVFDPQRDIYLGCIQTLKEAAGMIVEDGQGVTGDVLLNGDMGHWKRLANTIRLVAALRMSEVEPSTAAAEFASAFNDGVIALDNSENVLYWYQNAQTYENPYYNSFVTLGRRDWVIADPMMNWLQLDTYASPHRSKYKDGNPYKTQTGRLDVARDPRLPVYANPIENTTDTYIGMPYGLTEAEAGSVPAAQTSYLGNVFRQQNSPAYIYTAAQVYFILAEGALRNWIGGSAQDYYEQGILASFEQWGVEDEYDDYMLNSVVQFDGGNALEQIITQKWIATFPNGYEAWAEWRRTGYPELAPPDNALTPNLQIPTRQAYGTNEANQNTENHKAALARQGFSSDDLTGRVWWDVD